MTTVFNCSHINSVFPSFFFYREFRTSTESEFNLEWCVLSEATHAATETQALVRVYTLHPIAHLHTCTHLERTCVCCICWCALLAKFHALAGRSLKAVYTRSGVPFSLSSVRAADHGPSSACQHIPFSYHSGDSDHIGVRVCLRYIFIYILLASFTHTHIHIIPRFGVAEVAEKTPTSSNIQNKQITRSALITAPHRTELRCYHRLGECVCRARAHTASIYTVGCSIASPTAV